MATVIGQITVEFGPTPKTQTRPCPTCDHLGYSDVLDQGPPLVVVCTRCGMVFNDVAEDADYSGGKYVEQSKWDEVRYDEAVSRFASTGVPQDCAILDVGCATGGLMRALHLNGYYRVRGIDPSQKCVDRCNLWHGIKTDVGTLNDVTGHYGCVILSHVLEHIRDVSAAMYKLAEVAESVYVEVPDGLRYGEHVKSPYQNWNAEHVNHFDLEHLNMLFHAHGFQLRTCGEYTCEPDNFPAIWAWFTRRASLRKRQEGYGMVSANAMQRIEEQIKAVEGPVIAWGIGALARRLEPLLLGKVGNVADACGTGTYTHHEILNPGLVVWADWPILITTILYKDAVLADIKRLGLRNTVITLGD